MARTDRQKIFEVFESLVSRYGLDKVTMKDLAREAGISVGSIYTHFRNKDALIVAVEEKWCGHVQQRNASIIASDATSEEKLAKILVEHIELFSTLIRQDRAAYEMMVGAIQLRYIKRNLTDTRKEVFDAMIAGTTQVIAEGQEKGEFEVEDVEVTARLFVRAFAEYFSPGEVIRKEHEEVVQSAQDMFELLMNAVRTR